MAVALQGSDSVLFAQAIGSGLPQPTDIPLEAALAKNVSHLFKHASDCVLKPELALIFVPKLVTPKLCCWACSYLYCLGY
jgi:hypothetical protein